MRHVNTVLPSALEGVIIPARSNRRVLVATDSSSGHGSDLPSERILQHPQGDAASVTRHVIEVLRRR